MSVFRDVVAAHHGDSDAVLIAAREPCISIASDETRHATGRSFHILTPDELSGVQLRDSWILAVLLCPGDDAGAVARWVVATRRDPRRVLFYLHPATDVRAALRPWQEAALPIHSTWTVEDWRQLHKHLGAQWNVRVFDDFRQA